MDSTKRSRNSILVFFLLSASSLFIIAIIKYDLTAIFLDTSNVRTSRRLKSANRITNDPTPNMLYFHKDPSAFIDLLSHCFNSWQCSVLFHHLGKTGGSVVRDKIMDSFPPNKNLYRKVQGLYWDDYARGNMTNAFKANREMYCRAKFSSYQDVVFHDIVSACRWLKPETFQLIALIPFREPTSRTVSSINHFCNHGDLHSKTNEEMIACMSCDYKKHIAFFDSFTTLTNHDYIVNIDTAKTLGTMPNVKVLMYDLEDMTALFQGLQRKMPNKKLLPLNIKNTANTDICDFGMNSKMIKKLNPSFNIYRKFSNSDITSTKMSDYV